MFRSQITHNIARFRAAATEGGWDWRDLERAASDVAAGQARSTLAELRGIAQGAGVDQRAHLLYALVGHVVAPEECTVAAAVGDASATGQTLLLKNSDKIGADSLVGEVFHRFKEINVVVDFVSVAGPRIVGVAAAGTTNLKMGVNDAGVVAASNIVRTTQLRLRRAGVDDLRAKDRGQILREGLGHRTVDDAARWTVGAMIATPMATPGNVEFADVDSMVVIEGSYDHLAMERSRDQVVVRSNMFMLLRELNDPQDSSSPARYHRALELLGPRAGNITTDDLKSVSKDHGNGPGPDSICRHSEDYHDETSLSAMVVATNRDDPGETLVEIAVGKPCWAWDHGGVVSLRMSEPHEVIAERFLTGSAWRDFYREDARA
jgi:hypothetical protein